MGSFPEILVEVCDVSKSVLKTKNKQVSVADTALYDQDEQHKIRTLFLGSLEVFSVKGNELKKKERDYSGLVVGISKDMF